MLQDDIHLLSLHEKRCLWRVWSSATFNKASSDDFIATMAERDKNRDALALPPDWEAHALPPDQDSIDSSFSGISHELVNFNVMPYTNKLYFRLRGALSTTGLRFAISAPHSPQPDLGLSAVSPSSDCQALSPPPNCKALAPPLDIQVAFIFQLWRMVFESMSLTQIMWFKALSSVAHMLLKSKLYSYQIILSFLFCRFRNRPAPCLKQRPKNTAIF